MKILESWKKFEVFIERKSLPAVFVVGIFQIIGMITIGILVFWSFNFYEKMKSESYREEVFSNLVDANGYDKKIVGLKTFELNWITSLVETHQSVATIPTVPESAIFQDGGKNYVFLSSAMPQFFPDKNFVARDIVCIQGQVRKRNNDLSYGNFKDKFIVLYKYSVPKESDADFSRRSEGMQSQNERMRESTLRAIASETIGSNSKLHDGTCVDTFQGWIAKKSS